jgi:hypothetical protein
MYRIDKFLEYYNSLSDCGVEIEEGVWVKGKPLPFYYGVLTREYWTVLKDRLKDAYQVFKGKADAVRWR